jgi:hypothetical protein
VVGEPRSSRRDYGARKPLRAQAALHDAMRDVARCGLGATFTGELKARSEGARCYVFG